MPVFIVAPAALVVLAFAGELTRSASLDTAKGGTSTVAGSQLAPADSAAMPSGPHPTPAQNDLETPLPQMPGWSPGTLFAPRSLAALPEPPPVRAFYQLPPSAYCIVTHYTEGPYDYPALAAANQARYAQQHGYRHHAFVGRISGDQYVDESRGPLTDLWGGGLFWQKVTAVQRALNEGLADEDGERRRCEWVMWMDSDAVVTNQAVRLETIISRWAPPPGFYGEPSKDILLSREDDHPINAGVFLVRNTEVAHSFMTALSALYPMYRGSSLPEQAAIGTLAYLSEPWPANTAVYGVNAEVHPQIAVVPQRTFNSFYGLHHRFGPDGQWQPCDFIAHFAGTHHWARSDAIRQLLSDGDACEGIPPPHWLY